MGAACSGDKSAEQLAEKDVQIAKLKKAEAELKAKFDKAQKDLSHIDAALKRAIVPRTLKDIEQLEAKLNSDPNLNSGWNDKHEEALEKNTALTTHLETANEWIFDSFKLDELCGGFSLAPFAYFVFKEHDLLNEFHIVPQKMFNFFRRIQGKYLPRPYHNAVHAVDVGQAIHFWLRHGILSDASTSLQVLSGLTAAICHDCGHPAKNNAFMVNSKNQMALLYNDISVLENMHLSLLFETYNEDDCDFLSGTSRDEWQAFRKQTVSMVLATDFGRHNEILSIAQERLKQGQLDLAKEGDFDLAMRVGIKCADLRHCMMPHVMTQRTTALLMEEFWGQGDAEEEMGLPISPFMNRAKANLYKEQAGFYQFMIMPLMSVWSEMLPDESAVAMDYTKRNWETWQKKGKESAK
jgi:cAMP-specific phosphodiesterase 4